jgi:hypothetical protein
MYPYAELEPNPYTEAAKDFKETKDIKGLLTKVTKKIETSNDYFHFVGGYNTTKSYWKFYKEALEELQNSNKD